MAFSQSSNFTINHSTFIDKSTITKSISPHAKNRDGKGLQILINACSPEALFDSQARHPPPICHPSTRIGLLDYIFRWVDTGKEDILFLDGPAGVGKSAVAQTVAARSAARKMLGGSFFFFRGSSSRNTIAPLIPTITHQIIAPSPRKRKKVARAIELDPFIFDKSPEVQLHKLIIQPLCSSAFLWNKLSQRKRRLLIVDGLDECIDDNGQCQIVNLLGRLVDKDCGIVRCLIASRPEPHIISAVNSLKIKVARVTLNEQSWDANGDIRMYLRSGIDDIFSRRNLPQPWPSDAVIDTLTEKAGGIFIYASTVLKYMEDPDSLPTTQLEHVLSLIPGTTPFAALDQLYQEILTACPAQHRSTLLHIFGIIFLHNPLFKDFVDVLLIEAILGLSSGEVAMVLRRMHSIVAFRKSDSKTTITFLHASFGDFLFNQERSEQFFVDIIEEEWFLAGKCIDYLGHRDRGGLFSVLEKHVILYAWNSWLYHFNRAGDTYYTAFTEKLRLCDKSSWSQEFPMDYHHSCVSGLERAIAWFQDHNTGRFIHDGLLSQLTSVRQKLERNYCTRALSSTRHSLAILRVFEDPGINFFDLEGNYLVVLEQSGDTPKALYFKSPNKVYDLTERGVDIPSDFSLRFQAHLWEKSRHHSVAARCIQHLKNRWKSISNTQCVQYATKHWAEHLSRSNADPRLLYELETDRWADIAQADAAVVIEWLQKNKIKRHELLSSWKKLLDSTFHPAPIITSRLQYESRETQEEYNGGRNAWIARAPITPRGEAWRELIPIVRQLSPIIEIDWCDDDEG